MYTEAEAARLLRLAPATLHYWLEGGERRNKIYKPIIRAEATGSNRVTWAEFIEAGLIRQYRRVHQVPMTELRAFIEHLRDRSGIPYPLAHAQPFISGRELVVEAQEQAHLTGEFTLVAPVNGQYLLLAPAEAFLARVTWSDGQTAAGWRPDDRSDSPVTINPDVRFGSPSVGGISTKILYEMSQTEDEGDLADTYGLSISHLRWAVSFEMANAAA